MIAYWMQNNSLFIETLLYIARQLMVAFTIFGYPVYRYGLFYLITFVFGYGILRRVGQSHSIKRYHGVHKLLTTKLDDFFLIVVGCILLGGRLGHVFLYEWGYYSQHLTDILAINQGGMSFIGGVIGVTIGLLWMTWKWNLSKKDLLLLGDLILLIVPIGIVLGRFGNYLNQELRGKPVAEVGAQWQSLFRGLGLTTVYEAVDEQQRVNTNFIQSGLEGLITLLIGWITYSLTYIKGRIRPGLISGLFLLRYACARFFVEFFKDLPAYETVGLLSLSQWMVLFFAIAGMILIKNGISSVAE